MQFFRNSKQNRNLEHKSRCIQNWISQKAIQADSKFKIKSQAREINSLEKAQTKKKLPKNNAIQCRKHHEKELKIYYHKSFYLPTIQWHITGGKQEKARFSIQHLWLKFLPLMFYSNIRRLEIAVVIIIDFILLHKDSHLSFSIIFPTIESTSCSMLLTHEYYYHWMVIIIIFTYGYGKNVGKILYKKWKFAEVTEFCEKIRSY